MRRRPGALKPRSAAAGMQGGWCARLPGRRSFPPPADVARARARRLCPHPPGLICRFVIIPRSSASYLSSVQRLRKALHTPQTRPARPAFRRRPASLPETDPGARIRQPGTATRRRPDPVGLCYAQAPSGGSRGPARNPANNQPLAGLRMGGLRHVAALALLLSLLAPARGQQCETPLAVQPQASTLALGGGAPAFNQPLAPTSPDAAMGLQGSVAALSAQPCPADAEALVRHLGGATLQTSGPLQVYPSAVQASALCCAGLGWQAARRVPGDSSLAWSGVRRALRQARASWRPSSAPQARLGTLANVTLLSVAANLTTQPLAPLTAQPASAGGAPDGSAAAAQYTTSLTATLSGGWADVASPLAPIPRIELAGLRADTSAQVRPRCGAAVQLCLACGVGPGQQRTCAQRSSPAAVSSCQTHARPPSVRRCPRRLWAAARCCSCPASTSASRTTSACPAARCRSLCKWSCTARWPWRPQ